VHKFPYASFRTYGVATNELQDVDVEGDDGYNTSLPLADHLYALPESR